MSKKILIMTLTMVSGLVFVSGVWAQGYFPAGMGGEDFGSPLQLTHVTPAERVSSSNQINMNSAFQSYESFSGIIKKVDLANHEIVVQNKEGEMAFRVNKDTMITGVAAGKENKVLGELRERMPVTVSYIPGLYSWNAHEIDAIIQNFAAYRGNEYPYPYLFDCGAAC